MPGGTGIRRFCTRRALHVCCPEGGRKADSSAAIWRCLSLIGNIQFLEGCQLAQISLGLPTWED